MLMFNLVWAIESLIDVLVYAAFEILWIRVERGVGWKRRLAHIADYLSSLCICFVINRNVRFH